MVGPRSARPRRALRWCGRPSISTTRNAHPVCGWAGRTFLERADNERVAFGTQDETLLGQNWHAAESTEGFDFRWTSGRTAEVLVPLARRSDGHQSRRPGRSHIQGPRSSQFPIVNGTSLPERPMSTDWAPYEWTVDERLWFSGFNRLTIDVPKVVSPAAVGVSSDSRPLGIAVRALEAVRKKDPS